MSEKTPLKRAIFLRGVSDPAEFSRVTTTLFRPKHDDLRFEGGFVCSRELRVPVSNVVELVVLAEPAESAEQAPVEEVEEPKVEEVRRRGRPRKVTPS
jgi:hypothetical protein